MEEIQGLVVERPNVAQPYSVPKCLCISLIFLVAVFMWLVGFLVGKDVANEKFYAYLRENPLDGATLSPLSSPFTAGISNPVLPSGTNFPTTAPTLPPTEKKHLFSASMLKKAQALATANLEKLSVYYGDQASKVLLGDVGFGFGFSGKNKSPTNPTSFNHNVRIIARSLVHGESLKLGFIGSSVMCGHDNCYYDSFPSQLDRILKPVFEAAGSNVEIRNACQGGGCGDNFANQIFCFRHMVGDDVDFLFYEWTYFETGGFEYQFHDAIARWAAMLPKMASTIIFSAGGNAWGRKSVMESFAPYGSNALNLEDGLHAGVYKGKEWGVVGDGSHQTTRYGEGEDEKRKKSLGVVFRNWHPGPLGLQYIADLGAYLLLRATVEAIELILNSKQPEEDWPKNPVVFPPLPPISFSSKDNPLLFEVLQSLKEEPPGCLTMQKSTFGRNIVSISENPADVLNPYRNQVLKVNSENAWRLWEAGVNWQMVPREEQIFGDMCQPPDRCAYLQPPISLDKIPIVFRLPKMVVGLITLCTEFDGKKLDPANFVVFPNLKCLTIQQRFSGPLDNKNGHLYLAITTSDSNFKISQVITA